MNSRPHKAISNLYMGDDKSKLEHFSTSADKWYTCPIDFTFNLDPCISFRLTTSDGRVFISEPDKEMYEVLNMVDGNVNCPLLKRTVNINDNEPVWCGCIKCKAGDVVNDKIHCTAWDEEE